MEKNICPVCGYDKLRKPPYINGACPSFESCPSCDTEFGYDDFAPTIKEHKKKILLLRKKWEKNGCKWQSLVDQKPKNWSPKKQLKNLEKN